MRQVHIAHQPEDQGKPAGHQEIQPAQGDPVEQRVQEDLLACRSGPISQFGPDGKDHPQAGSATPAIDKDHGPDRMMSGEKRSSLRWIPAGELRQTQIGRHVGTVAFLPVDARFRDPS